MRRLLFIAPAVPSPTRSGLRMRGWLFLTALAREYRVTLVAGSPAFPDESRQDTEALGDLVERTVLLRFGSLRDPALLRRRVASVFGQTPRPSLDWAEPTPSMLRRLAPLREQPFDLIHLFRLYMLPVALAARGGRYAIQIQLDLDDWESKTRLAQAELLGASDPQQAARFRAESAAFEVREREWLPRMARCFVCSTKDADSLAACYGLSRIAVVENAVSVPAARPSEAITDLDEILFVGSLGYLPNEDAVRFLIDEVVPLLRTTLTRAFRVVVAGTGASVSLRKRLRGTPEVVWLDAPARIEPLYERARIALVPVRAGGGTRIKALEAFAQGRPVIATAAAMDGLGIEPGVHYLRAESPVDWAGGVRSLLDTPALRRSLVAAAFAWVREHSMEKAVERVVSLAGDFSSAASDSAKQPEPLI